jgi:hypothetical protein
MSRNGNKFNAKLQGENSFIYKFENGDYKIDHPLKQPKSLFKYYSNSKYSFESLEEKYLYLSHPFDFNDSLDSHELLWDFSNLKLKDYLNFYINRTNLNAQDLKLKYTSDQNDNFSAIRRAFFFDLTKKTGMVSLTDSPLNTLMWAHYSGENGFMIELDTKDIIDNIEKNNAQLNNHIFFPINYVNKLKQISLPASYKSMDVPFLYTVGTKLKEWKYENEWRIVSFINDMGIPLGKVSALKKDIVGSNGRKLFYSESAVKKIILGRYFFNKSFVSHTKSKTPLDPVVYHFKHSQQAKFIDLINKLYPNNIYMSGITADKGVLKRSYEQINFKKLGYNKFKRIRTNNVQFF